MAALACLWIWTVRNAAALRDFYTRWQDDSLVPINGEPPAISSLPGTLECEGADHPIFSFESEQGESVDWRSPAISCDFTVRIVPDMFLADPDPETSIQWLHDCWHPVNGAVSTSSGNWRCRGNLAGYWKNRACPAMCTRSPRSRWIKVVYLAVAMGLQALRVMAQCLAWSCPDVEERVHLFLGHGEYA